MATRSRRIGLLLGIVALAGALAPAAQQPADPNKALAQEQLKLTRQALSDLDLLSKSGEVPTWDAKFVLWERRQVEAIRASGAGKAEVIAALESYVKRLRELERHMQAAYQKAEASRVDAYDARYRLFEAEMWLNQEKAR
jgi:hypothetical protein